MKPTCFVVMGFGVKTDYRTSRVLDLDKAYKHIIKKAVEDAGLQCIRADEIPHSGTIDVPMYEQLMDADLVIADLSTSNLNAAYELGVRHALKPSTTIIIAESEFTSPFDVNHLLIRRYRHDGKALDIDEVERFRAELGQAIRAILDTPRTDSPVYTFIQPLQPPARRAARASKPPPAPESAARAAARDEPTLSALMEQVQKAKGNQDFVAAKTLLELARTLAPTASYIVQQLALVTYKAKQPNERAALEQARELLLGLDPLGSNNAETLGLWGAVHKRLFELTKDASLLDKAIFAYEKGCRLLGDHYNGINWAFLLDVRASLGSPADAVADYVLARRARKDVLELCQQKLAGLKESDATRNDRYWMLATMAEAAFGLGDQALASQFLEQGRQLGPAAWMLQSSAEQLDKLRSLLSDLEPRMQARLTRLDA